MWAVYVANEQYHVHSKTLHKTHASIQNESNKYEILPLAASGKHNSDCQFLMQSTDLSRCYPSFVGKSYILRVKL